MPSILDFPPCRPCRKLLLAEPVDEERILEQAFMFFDRDGNREISIAEVG